MHPKRAVVLAKIETSYGVDPTPAADVNAIVTSLPTIKPVLDALTRNIATPSLSPLAPIKIGTEVQIDFEVEARPASAAGSVPEIGPLLRACGFEETISEGVGVSYAPVSTDHESVTLYAWRETILHKVSGCRGTVKLTAEANKYGTWMFSFRGLYQGPVDYALPTPTYTAVLAAIVRASDLVITPIADFSAGTGKANTVTGGSTTISTTAGAFSVLKRGSLIKANNLTRTVLSVAADHNSAVVDATVDWYNTGSGFDWTYKDSWLPVISKIEIDMANDLQPRPDITADTGIAGIEIAGRTPKITLDPEVTTLADRNVWNAIVNQVYHELVLAFGASTRITASCPKVAFDAADYGERGARLTHSLTASPEYDEGDDEVIFSF